MIEKLALFHEKVKQAENAALIDSLLDHAKKADVSLEYYEATKIIKHELLERLKIK